jgi:hypothetical protein
MSPVAGGDGGYDFVGRGLLELHVPGLGRALEVQVVGLVVDHAVLILENL